MIGNYWDNQQLFFTVAWWPSISSGSLWRLCGARRSIFIAAMMVEKNRRANRRIAMLWDSVAETRPTKSSTRSRRHPYSIGDGARQFSAASATEPGAAALSCRLSLLQATVLPGSMYAAQGSWCSHRQSQRSQLPVSHAGYTASSASAGRVVSVGVGRVRVRLVGRVRARLVVRRGCSRASWQRR